MHLPILSMSSTLPPSTPPADTIIAPADASRPHAVPVDAESSLASPEMGSPISIMGVPFDNVTTRHTLSLIQRMVESRAPHYIATANVDFLVQAQSDAELRRILLDAHLVLCDGQPLIWASRWLGNPLPERVAGSDLVPLILRLAIEHKYRIFLLGAAEEMNKRAAEKMQVDYPGLIVAGRYSPPYAPLEKMDHEGIRKIIREARPDIVLVAFGCPKQEKWISMNYRETGVPVSVGVGATIDFLAGAILRAPLWMRKCGLEWTWRILMEPRRLVGRYAKGLWVFGFGLLSQRWRTAAPSRRPTVLPPIAPTPIEPDASATAAKADAEDAPESPIQKLVMPKRLDAGSVRELRSGWETLPQCECVVIDLSDTEFVDSTGVGFLIQLRRLAKDRGARFALAAVAPKVWRTIEMLKLASSFPVGATVELAVENAA